MPALTYDDDNREIRFSSRYLRGRRKEILKVNWSPGIRRNAEINAGDTLATLQWSVGEDEPVVVPEGCNGVIEKVNRKIDHVSLRHRPAQFALILKWRAE